MLSDDGLLYLLIFIVLLLVDLLILFRCIIDLFISSLFMSDRGDLHRRRFHGCLA